MRSLVIGGVIYLGLAVTGWLIGDFFVSDSLFKTETLTVYVPEPHIVREIITMSPSPTLTPEPPPIRAPVGAEANSPESGQPQMSSAPEAPAVPIAIAPTPVPTPAPTSAPTMTATSVPIPQPTPCAGPGNSDGHAGGWRKKHC